MSNYNDDQEGGFIPQSLPSPAPSNASFSSTTSNLPHPRAHPLKPGSAKEDAARRYVEWRLLYISRRYTKKFQPAEDHGKDEVVGYTSFRDVAKDLGDVVDVLWISGTPSLQIPYLLNIASTFTTYLTAFPQTANATFKLLRKLDYAFSSLMKGTDTITGEALPGFEGGRGMTLTEMVRCKSLVESTRVLIVDYMASAEPEMMDGTEGDESMAESGREGEDGEWEGEEEERLEMDVARVYERSIVQLNESGLVGLLTVP